ncbi:MAG: hypothetical protein ABIR96_06765 [Bdellovibrionota bacterium]
MHASFKLFIVGLVSMSSMLAFSQTVELGGEGNPCESQAARDKIIEQLFTSQENASPLVFDQTSKAKVSEILKDFVAGKHVASKDDLKEIRKETPESVCHIEARKQIDSEADYPGYDRLKTQMLTKIKKGEVSPEMKMKLEEGFKRRVDEFEHKIGPNDDGVEVFSKKNMKTAEALSKKLASSNSLSARDAENLGNLLHDYNTNNLSGNKYRFGWDYAVEKDAKSGESYVAAYRAAYEGNGCMGYGPLGRVSQMPVYRIPAKYFDKKKIAKWANDEEGGYKPGYGTWNFESLPLNLASFSSSCPMQDKKIVKERDPNKKLPNGSYPDGSAAGYVH